MNFKQLLAIENRVLGRLEIAFGAIGCLFVLLAWTHDGSQPGPAAPATDAKEIMSLEQTTPQVGNASADAVAPAPAEAAPPQPRIEHYTVRSGDTLEAIFKSLNLPVRQLYNILEADEPYLVIDTLQPGDQLTFRFDDQDQLVELSRVIDPSKTVAYQLADDGGFTYRETVIPTTWETEVVHGTVNGSFYLSARRAGLSDGSIMTIDHLLQNRVNFRRDLRAGDRFDVVVKKETVNGNPTGNRWIQAVEIEAGRQQYTAFLHTDGSYYDERGDSLTPALLRYPTKRHYRISSSFNPRRLNPVTHRYAPHNGTDFSMPVGTPVVATGDGIVSRTAVHRFAGKYLVLDEYGPYATRYLHLSKILVHKGQRVKRGQIIALSGNTGRSTGPHLHYELHIRNRPVNPMTAKIPMLKSIPRTELADYRQRVKTLEGLMAGAETRIVQNAENQPGELKVAQASTDSRG